MTKAVCSRESGRLWRMESRRAEDIGRRCGRGKIKRGGIFFAAGERKGGEVRGQCQRYGQR